MLKKVQVSQLREGMYIHELCGSWLSSPFWQKSFAIGDEKILLKVKKSSIKEAWIDTEKGLDVIEELIEVAIKLEPEPTSSIPTDLPKNPPKKIEDFSAVNKISFAAEIGRAAEIVDQSKEAVCTMFNEARMGKAIESEQAMYLVEEIAGSVMRNPSALIGLARLKTADDYTYMHSVAVCALMIALSRQLNLSDEETREAGLAGLLHDIGKMSVPLDILNKPGRLTDEEFVSVKSHPLAGYEMLKEARGVSDIALDVCLHHHEKMDGTGYPKGLKGEQISLYAKMGAVCDVYDAITSNRPYKPGWCPAESLRKMSEWTGWHFDETVFQAFIRSIGIYPVGTLVQLQSGRLGVVIEQQVGKSLLHPKVRVFFSTKSNTYITPLLLDLAGPGLQDKIISREEASAWGIKDFNQFWLGDLEK